MQFPLSKTVFVLILNLLCKDRLFSNIQYTIQRNLIFFNGLLIQLKIFLDYGRQILYVLGANIIIIIPKRAIAPPIRSYLSGTIPFTFHPQRIAIAINIPSLPRVAKTK